ncbi:hypothetical protein DEA98_25710 [Brucella pseudogrignonensis]|nr:hypothetical protein [Brucella pseudogrignonensis]
MAGLNRIRCMNSLVTQTGTIDAIRVRHSHDATQKSSRATIRCSKRRSGPSAPQQCSQPLPTAPACPQCGQRQNPIKPQQLLQPDAAATRLSGSTRPSGCWVKNGKEFKLVPRR